MWINLIVNLANVSLLILVLQLVFDRVEHESSCWARVFFGVITGGCACVSMGLAEPIMPGFIFDLRAPLIACAAFFAGPLALIPSGLIASGFRLSMGGDGAIPGLVSIWMAGAAGLAAGAFSRGERVHNARLLILCATLCASFQLSYLAVPATIRSDLYMATAAPATMLTGIATIIIAMLLQREIARKELARSNLVYRQMVDSLPHCLNARDRDGRFLAANPATARLLDVGNAADLIGQTEAAFHPHDARPALREEERAVLTDGESRVIEQDILDGSGQKTSVVTLILPMRDSGGAIFGIITHNRDVSHEKKMQQLKAEFISTVSHELRTPLTSIRGSLSLVASGVKGDLAPDVMKLITMAKRNSERLVLLINDLLDIDKIETGKMVFNFTNANVGKIVQEAIQSNANYMPERRVTVSFDNQAPELRADIDTHRLTQVITNLLSNAVKFSPVGGHVDLALKSIDTNSLQVSVSDEGRGVPPAFRERIFGKFEQVDSSDSKQRDGTGLGLHISRRIVEDMGGRIGLNESRISGACFEIVLPLQNQACQTPTRIAALEPSPSTGETSEGARHTPALSKVLYIEDDMGLGEFVAQTLSPDIETVHVPTLALARQALSENDFDLVIIDRELPDGSGLTVIDDLVPDTPILTFTADDIDVPTSPRIDMKMIKTRVSEEDLARQVRHLLKTRQARSNMSGAVQSQTAAE